MAAGRRGRTQSSDLFPAQEGEAAGTGLRTESLVVGIEGKQIRGSVVRRKLTL